MSGRQQVRTATYEPHESGWLVNVRRGSEAVTAYGRTLAKARQAIVSTLSKALGEYPGHVVLKDSIRMSRAAKSALEDARRKKAAALVATAESQTATEQAAKALVAEGFSLRDCAYLLGLSHARVQQLTKVEATE